MDKDIYAIEDKWFYFITDDDYESGYESGPFPIKAAAVIAFRKETVNYRTVKNYAIDSFEL
jgi:hypothetical protein